MTPSPIPINNSAATMAAGIAYPNTENGWRWLYRNRLERGLAHCFVRLGRRVLVDPQAYLDALAEQRQGGVPSGGRRPPPPAPAARRRPTKRGRAGGAR